MLTRDHRRAIQLLKIPQKRITSMPVTRPSSDTITYHAGRIVIQYSPIAIVKIDAGVGFQEANARRFFNGYPICKAASNWRMVFGRST